MIKTWKIITQYNNIIIIIVLSLAAAALVYYLYTKKSRKNDYDGFDDGFAVLTWDAVKDIYRKSGGIYPLFTQHTP